MRAVIIGFGILLGKQCGIVRLEDLAPERAAEFLLFILNICSNGWCVFPVKYLITEKKSEVELERFCDYPLVPT